MFKIPTSVAEEILKTAIMVGKHNLSDHHFIDPSDGDAKTLQKPFFIIIDIANPKSFWVLDHLPTLFLVLFCTAGGIVPPNFEDMLPKILALPRPMKAYITSEITLIIYDSTKNPGYLLCHEESSVFCAVCQHHHTHYDQRSQWVHIFLFCTLVFFMYRIAKLMMRDVCVPQETYGNYAYGGCCW